MKAIQVRFLPATNFKGARLKAFTEGGNSHVIPFLYEVSSDVGRATVAAVELISKMGWQVEITGHGVLPCGDYVFTIAA